MGRFNLPILVLFGLLALVSLSWQTSSLNGLKYQDPDNLNYQHTNNRKNQDPDNLEHQSPGDTTYQTNSELKYQSPNSFKYQHSDDLECEDFDTLNCENFDNFGYQESTGGCALPNYVVPWLPEHILQELLIPNSPVGLQFKDWLYAFNDCPSQDATVIEYHEHRMNAGDEIVTLDQELSIHRATFGLNFKRLRESTVTQTSLTAILQEFKSEKFVEVGFEVADAAPYNITKLTINAIPVPDEFLSCKDSSDSIIDATRFIDTISSLIGAHQPSYGQRMITYLRAQAANGVYDNLTNTNFTRTFIKDLHVASGKFYTAQGILQEAVMRLNEGLSAGKSACKGLTSCKQRNANLRAHSLGAAKRVWLVDSIAREVEAHYLYPDVGKKMARFIRDRSANGDYDSIFSASDFAQTLTQDLIAICHNPRLTVKFQNESSTGLKIGTPHDEDVNGLEDTNKTTLAYMERVYMGFDVCREMGRGIKVVAIDDFVPVRAAIAASARVLAQGTALVLDLRENAGGHRRAIQWVASYLFDEEPVHLMDIEWPDEGGRVEEFWTDPALLGSKFGSKKPLYILTSKRTVREGEEFAHALQSLNRATIVGEQTAGVADPIGQYEIDDHWAVVMPRGRILNPATGTGWEGMVVYPDVSVRAADALEEALKRVREDLRPFEGTFIRKSDLYLIMNSSILEIEARDTASLVGKAMISYISDRTLFGSYYNLERVEDLTRQMVTDLVKINHDKQMSEDIVEKAVNMAWTGHCALEEEKRRRNEKDIKRRRKQWEELVRWKKEIRVDTATVKDGLKNFSLDATRKARLINHMIDEFEHVDVVPLGLKTIREYLYNLTTTNSTNWFTDYDRFTRIVIEELYICGSCFLDRMTTELAVESALVTAWKEETQKANENEKALEEEKKTIRYRHLGTLLPWILSKIHDALKAPKMDPVLGQDISQRLMWQTRIAQYPSGLTDLNAIRCQAIEDLTFISHNRQMSEQIVNDAIESVWEDVRDCDEQWWVYQHPVGTPKCQKVSEAEKVHADVQACADEKACLEEKMHKDFLIAIEWFRNSTLDDIKRTWLLNNIITTPTGSILMPYYSCIRADTYTNISDINGLTRKVVTDLVHCLVDRHSAEALLEKGLVKAWKTDRQSTRQEAITHKAKKARASAFWAHHLNKHQRTWLFEIIAYGISVRADIPPAVGNAYIQYLHPLANAGIYDSLATVELASRLVTDLVFCGCDVQTADAIVETAFEKMQEIEWGMVGMVGMQGELVRWTDRGNEKVASYAKKLLRVLSAWLETAREFLIGLLHDRPFTQPSVMETYGYPDY